ncbi:MAG: hypothetical protein WCI90_01950 [Chlorobium sp.]|nr:MAG: hypothetical protein FDX17_09600 [Chlorobium sp.]
MQKELNIEKEKLIDTYGKDRYMKLIYKISTVQKIAEILGAAAKKVLGDRYSDKYLQTIYIPFLAQLIQADQIRPLNRLQSPTFQNISQLLLYLWPDWHSSIFENNRKWPEGNYDIIFDNRLNIYEKYVFKLFGISYCELQNAITEKEIVREDFKLRSILLKYLANVNDIFSAELIVDYLPCSLFEGLLTNTNIVNYPSAKVLWLGQIHNESYLFYLAYMKDKGVKVIAQTHGGAISQVEYIFATDISERLLSDIHHSGMWGNIYKAYPNWRASRNLFLNKKYFTYKKKQKILVITTFFLIESRSEHKIWYSNNITSEEFYHKRLKDLNNHFDAAFDFMAHPYQHDFDVKLSYLKSLYPDCAFIKNISVQEASHHYDAVIHLDTWATALIELSGTNIRQYVYLGPELLLNQGYERFLWNNKKSSTKKECINGCYVEVNNKKYKAAYGGSYLYPFYYARLIKKLKSQL